MSSRLALAAVIAAFAAGQADGARAPQARTIRLTSITVSLVTHDKKPKGASKGDTIVYRDTLVNATPQFGRKTGAVVGSDSGIMTFTSAHTAVFRGVAKLPGGTLTLAGPVTGTSGGLVIPVTGGTGAYARMHGTLTVGPGSKRAPNTYRLMRGSLTAPVA